MKNKRTLMGVLALSVLVSAIPVSASFKLNYNNSNSEYVVTGKMPAAIAGQTVTVTIKDSSDTLIFARQINTDVNGKYSLPFGIAQTGNMTLNVSEDGSLSSQAIAIDNTDLGSALTRFNSSEIEDDVITDKYKVLLVNLSQFNSYKTGSPLLTYLSGKTANNLEDFLKIYYKGIFLTDVQRASSSTGLYEKMLECEIFNSTKNAASVFNAYTQSEKNQIISTLCGKSYTSDEMFENALCEAVILNELSKATTDDGKYAVVEQNNDVLAIPLSTYSGLGSQFDDYKTSVFGLSYTDLAGLKNNFAATYTLFTSGGGTPSYPQHSGGGGYSGSSSVKVDSSLITTPVVNNTGTYFSDLESCAWAKDAIIALAQRNVISGKGNGLFAPNDTVTRAEFTKMAVSAFGFYNANASVDFADVDKNSWEYQYVASAVARDIIKGVGGNMFNGSSFITREDLAVICYRVLKIVAPSKIDTTKGIQFADLSDTSDYAVEAVAALSGAGIINGKGDNRFWPKDVATRAEAAKIIHSMLGGK